MKQDEIIEMARQVGLEKILWRVDLAVIQAFAKLVAAKEREACHALRQTLPNPYTHCQVSAHACDMAFVEYGKAIRARAQADRGEA